MNADNNNNRAFTILGQVPSKSNAYRIVSVAGHSSLAKTPALKAYEQAFFLQCPMRDAMISERFGMRLRVFYASDRPDLDNALKIILDCLQQCRAIRNDRLCVRIEADKFVDKKNPRAEIELWTMM